ncbi:MAG TPA: peptidoglycan DD-metalloendopeptidase family protein [Burkholderiales bacterium]|nr:peptidoglycan DD-metalloendopeptidase family protein [Burkholderiales bacterium]
MLIAAVLAAPAHAGKRERDLEALRARIAALSTELNEKQASRREARDALRDSERAISDANRALAELDADGRVLRAQSDALEARRRSLTRRLALQQAALGKILAARYEGGAPGALRLVLSGEDPGEVARKLYYLTRVSQASAGLVASMRDGLAELADLRRELDARSARLAEVTLAQRADRERVLAEQRKRQHVLAKLGDEIRRDQKQIKVLRADEARLSRLVEEIGRVLATKPGAGYARVEKVPEPGAASGPFDTLRGKLRLPVRGELTGRFGAQRGNAGINLKGVFIRAPEGRQVRAIAAGQVVFADWMRGFGNLLIIDHGEAYLSVYANNETLLRQVGDIVAAGEPIATVGATGGIEESGLYFELRHLGKPFDPLTWVNLK